MGRRRRWKVEIMVRFFMAAILVFSLSGCAADDVEVAAVDASILMSTGEEVAGQERDEVNLIPMEIPVTADTLYGVTDHTLEARIFDFPEGPGGNNFPFEDLSIFDVIPESKTDASLVERSRPSSEEPVAPRKDPVVTKIAPPPEPPVSGGVAGNSYLIQLGALPSKESARREWTRFERQFPDLVRNQFPIIVPVELNPQMGKVFRLRTGPIGEFKSANSLCRKFKSHGQDCFVVRIDNPS